jgi:hypothetical protein
MAQSKEPQATRMESADEILQAIAARKARRAPGGGNAPTPHTKGVPPLPGIPSVAEAQRDRPVQRPPMALLCILDDGKQEGEWVRLRADRTTLGRTDGDVRIVHDMQMSAQHAEIVREATPTGWRWLLQDCGSTNGTFVRVGSTVLRNNNELLLGQGRYRFEAGMAPGSAGPAIELSGATQMPQTAALKGLVPSLVEITAAGAVQRFVLTLPEYWFGSDPRSATIVRLDDPFVDAQHARFFRDQSGQWHAANNGSINGLWLRIKAIPLDKSCHFRLGEQRFIFRAPES